MLAASPRRTTLSWQRAVKRAIDITVSATALVVLAPLLALIAATIRLSSRGPALYRWPVVGQDGKRIKAFKFRTMVLEADQLKADLVEKNEATGPVFKMRRDPRVTPVGRVLRKFSLDEFPQLWTVLTGEMSLVGPRPLLVDEWASLEPWQRRKLSVKPGIVCLWHLRGQPRDFNEWVRLDLEYIDSWSLWLDLKLLLWVPFYAVSGRNY